MKQLLEALDLALEALELEDMACRYEKESTPEHIAKAITAIKQARSAPVQEPHSWYSAEHDEWMTDKTRKEHERLNSYTHKVGGFDLPLYTSPPAAQRQWVSLTADERYDIRASFRGRFLETSEFAEQVQLATEAKLKEKNT
jgi:hypothetical protein